MRKIFLFSCIVVCAASAHASDGERKTADQETKRSAAVAELGQQERKVSAAQEKISKLMPRCKDVADILAQQCPQLPTTVCAHIVEYQKSQPMFKCGAEFATMRENGEERLGTLQIFKIGNQQCVTQGLFVYCHDRLSGHVRKNSLPFYAKNYITYSQPSASGCKQMLCTHKTIRNDSKPITCIECGQLDASDGIGREITLPLRGNFKPSKIACLATQTAQFIVAMQAGVECALMDDSFGVPRQDHCVVLKNGLLDKRLSIPQGESALISGLNNVQDVTICGDHAQQYVACYLAAENSTPDKDGVIHDTLAFYDLAREQPFPKKEVSVPRVLGNKKIASAVDCNGKMVIIVPNGVELQLFDASNGKQTAALKSSLRQPISNCIAQNVGNHTLVAALRSGDRERSDVDVWDLETGELVAQHHMNYPCLDIALSDEGVLATHTQECDQQGLHWRIDSWVLKEK